MIAVEVAAFGGPEVLHVVERAPPAPGPGELVIRVEACGLNWSDLLQRAGTYPGGPRPPFIAGQEAAGIVVAHGAGVSAPPIGAAVSAIAATGLCAELAAVPAASCIVWPRSEARLDDRPGAAPAVVLAAAVTPMVAPGLAPGLAAEAAPMVAPGLAPVLAPGLAPVVAPGLAPGLAPVLAADQRAALPIALLTAYHALATCARAAPGELAVIHAAAGGVGSIAVQVARLLGLGVIATCGADKRAYVTADRVCGYDELRRAAPDGVDVVLDGVGGDVFRASCGVLRPFGRIVVIGASSGEPQRIDAVKLVHRSHAVIGVHLRGLLARPDLLGRAIAACAPWVRDGQVRARVTALPVSEIRAAHVRLAAREVIGKLVVTLPMELPPRP
jgi:NADPH:quinone reductase-like Zn-dependent oxidoreductase